MKTILLYVILLLFSVFNIQAQEPEHLAPYKTYWQSFGFQKQPDFAKIAYYKSDSLGYEPVMAEVISFNKEGKLIQKYIRIFGKYASETAHNYVYKNGVLDSINTQASAKSFNATQKLHYDANGLLQKVTASGVYTNFMDTYTYNPNGMVSSIDRKYQNGGGKQAFFDHQKNIVTEKQTNTKGAITETIFVYDGDTVLASFTKASPKVTLFDSYRRIHFETELKENALAYLLDLRKLKQENLQAFRDKIGVLRGKKTSAIIVDIPAQASNMEGDWTKRLQLDKRFGAQRRLVFRQLKYANRSQSGSTDYDLIFENKVKNIK